MQTFNSLDCCPKHFTIRLPADFFIMGDRCKGQRDVNLCSPSTGKRLAQILALGLDQHLASDTESLGLAASLLVTFTSARPLLINEHLTCSPQRKQRGFLSASCRLYLPRTLRSVYGAQSTLHRTICMKTFVRLSRKQGTSLGCPLSVHWLQEFYHIVSGQEVISFRVRRLLAR